MMMFFPPWKGATMDVPSTITVRGTEMIYIPAGKFLMGSDAYAGEKPHHEVYLDSFYIARYPVTNAQYKEFVAATEHRSPRHWKAGTYPEGEENHPVRFVSWRDALAYCSWLSEETGEEMRLPTEAEWEKAARGTDGRRYPWGDEFDKLKCNSSESATGTTPVDKYSPHGDSPYGVADMAANVWEWCSSLKKDYPYNPDDGREDLEAEGSRVLRGGSFFTARFNARVAARNDSDPDTDFDVTGLRVVVFPPDSP
jgi:formylglycine-generating enzyme required for sulfatase activity